MIYSWTSDLHDYLLLILWKIMIINDDILMIIIEDPMIITRRNDPHDSLLVILMILRGNNQSHDAKKKKDMHKCWKYHSSEKCHLISLWIKKNLPWQVLTVRNENCQKKYFQLSMN